MAVRKILKYPHDEARLRKKSAEVKRLDTDIKKLIGDLKDTLATQPGAGLAAPQVGIYKRVALVRFGQDKGEMEPPLALINPAIVDSGPLDKGFDGCLSLPGIVTWDTVRPSWLVFRARDEQWQKIEMRVEGIDAIVVHHEIDHLDGVLFLDRLDKDGKLYVSEIDANGEQKLVELNRLIARSI
ncbi:MAG: peptide deformylase [Anaerolineae bacterium]|nr:peptide deformylase [Anaerolineae bacterium]